MRRCEWIIWVTIGLGLANLCGAQENPAPAVVDAPMTVEQVVRNLQEKNQIRSRALHEFQGTRTYRMKYRGFPSDRDAEMVVNMTYQSPDKKDFTVVSETGSKFIINRVFKKLLEGEQEAANEDNQRRTALSTQNYDFALEGFEPSAEGGTYVLQLSPKTANKFLVRGKIWVNGKDFAVVRIEGEPAKNPSFWIKKSRVEHMYTKVNGFWFPAENHTTSWIRLGGRAELSIEYRNYKIIEAGPLNRIQTGGPQPTITAAFQ